MLKTLIAAALAAALAAASATLAQAADNPRPRAKGFTSKIGMHLIGAYTPGTQTMVRARCPVLKILDLSDDMLKAARDYKRFNPDGRVVLRVFHTRRYSLDDPPEATAEKHWKEVISAPIDKLAPADRKLIDYVEAINEMGECPTWESEQDTAWFTRFSIRFVELCSKSGFKPVLACIPVGNPPGDNAGVARILQYAPSLRAAKKAGGCWSYHCYTIKYTTDSEVEIWYSLRYRKFYAAFTGPYADLKDMPMIMTEGGVDLAGNADKDGWQARGTAEQYKTWLKWFDSELKKDRYMIGVTLFQQGAKAAWGGWASFDHEPVAEWLASYWGKPAAH